MALHPEIAKALASFPPPPEGPLDPVAMRAAEEAHVAPLQEREPVHLVKEMTVHSVPTRVYMPAEAKHASFIVYFHGGAFFLGSLDTHDHIARRLANETGYTVISVGYRLAPEHTFPAGLDDCYTVVKAVVEDAEEMGVDDALQLAIVGDSSGGNFVAAVAAMAKDDGFEHITHQVLFYPSLDLDFDESRYPSLVENAVGYGLETAGLKPFNDFYLSSGADPDDPLVSPIKRKDLSGLPKALILTGEHDPLRDEGELYGARLQEAGVETKVSRYAGAGHGFVQHFGWLPEYGKAYAETAAFLKDA